MKCPICNEEVRDTEQAQRWGPEFAHSTCVTAYNYGRSDAMTPEQIAHIMALVDDHASAILPGYLSGPVDPIKTRAAVEAALRDAPTSKPLFGEMIAQHPGLREEMLTDAVEPDERALSHELIKVAAWLLSPEPTRQIDRLEDQTHIGHRQFENAQEAMRETLRNKAFEIRKFVDARAIERAVLGRGEKL